MTSTSARAPGKLYVAGEYAVVEPGNPAIVVAIDRFVTVTATSRGKRAAVLAGTITSELTNGNPVPWRLSDGAATMDGPYAPHTKHIRAALSVSSRYLSENGFSATTLDLVVSSTMTSSAGIKLGLGSSGSVTVATIAAVLAHLGLETTPRQVYRLAMLATILVDPSASGGDLASAVYGGWILYRSPDRGALCDSYRAGRNITEIIGDVWREHQIMHLPAPHCVMHVGWVGVAASSTNQVRQLHEIADGGQRTEELDTFHQASELLVRSLATALLENDLDSFTQGIKSARLLLGCLEQWTGISIETPELQALCESAQAIGAAAKSSGAGGGDCGIAFVSDSEEESKLLHAWRSHLIEPLDLRPYSHTIEVNFDRAR